MLENMILCSRSVHVIEVIEAGLLLYSAFDLSPFSTIGVISFACFHSLVTFFSLNEH